MYLHGVDLMDGLGRRVWEQKVDEEYVAVVAVVVDLDELAVCCPVWGVLRFVVLKVGMRVGAVLRRKRKDSVFRHYTDPLY